MRGGGAKPISTQLLFCFRRYQVEGEEKKKGKRISARPRLLLLLIRRRGKKGKEKEKKKKEKGREINEGVGTWLDGQQVDASRRLTRDGRKRKKEEAVCSPRGFGHSWVERRKKKKRGKNSPSRRLLVDPSRRGKREKKLENERVPSSLLLPLNRKKRRKSKQNYSPVSPSTPRGKEGKKKKGGKKNVFLPPE